MNKVQAKVKELQQLIQQEYGVVSEVYLYVHSLNTNPHIKQEDAERICNDIAGRNLKVHHYPEPTHCYYRADGSERLSVVVWYPDTADKEIVKA